MTSEQRAASSEQWAASDGDEQRGLASREPWECERPRLQRTSPACHLRLPSAQCPVSTVHTLPTLSPTAPGHCALWGLLRGLRCIADDGEDEGRSDGLAGWKLRL